MLSFLFTTSHNNEESNDERRSMNERERPDYESISERFDSGFDYGCSNYPIEDDDSTTYCTSKHPHINFFFYTSFYLAFLIFGAIVFMIIEQPEEFKVRENIIRHQETFLAKYTNVDPHDLNALLHAVLKAQSNGYYVPIVGSDLMPPTPVLATRTKRSLPEKPVLQQQSPPDKYSDPQTQPLSPTSSSISDITNAGSNREHNSNENESSRLTPIKFIYNWRFSSSLLFVTSLVTTIGYGNLTPLTTIGKIACILFCVVGVPATLVFLSTLVRLFVRGPVKRVEGWIIRIILCLHRTAPVFTVRMMHLILITSILLCICFLIPAYAFYLMEKNWTYLDAFYCCFITLTTIGLGDFVPGIDGFVVDLLYPLAIITYLFFGLSMIMVWLALIHQIPQLQLGDALIRDEKEADKIQEEENNRARERLHILANQIILHDTLKKLANLHDVVVQK